MSTRTLFRVAYLTAGLALIFSALSVLVAVGEPDPPASPPEVVPVVPAVPLPAPTTTAPPTTLPPTREQQIIVANRIATQGYGSLGPVGYSAWGCVGAVGYP